MRFSASLPRLLRVPSILAIHFGALVTAAHGQTWEDCNPRYSYFGENAGDQFGWIGVVAGDVDQDGTQDFLLTAPFFNGGQGKVYLYSGKTGLLITSHTGSPASHFGYMASAAGDVNQDGHADYLIGAPDLTNTTPGSAFLYSGKDGAILRSWTGELPGDQFGKSVSGEGDVDNDGLNDAIIAAPRNDKNGISSGKAHVYSGLDGSELYAYEGTAAGHFMGSGVGYIGDRDQDGHDDFIIGAIGAGPAGRGEAYVQAGVDGSRFCTLSGDATGQLFGLYWLGYAGDVNADGTDDFFVTDYTNSALGASTGRAYIYSGTDCSIIHTLTGLKAGDAFGIGRGWMGDVDADGHDDLVFAHWTNSQGAPSGGRLSVFSGKDASILGRFTGTVAGATLGFDVAGMGDLDGDGAPEILGTAANESGLRGSAHVFSMSPAPPRQYCIGAPNSVGTGATINYSKHTSIAKADFRVRMHQAPPTVPAVFFYGPNQASAPFNDGFLCVSGSLQRLSPVATNAAGTAILDLDFTSPPISTGPSAITPGSTWHFQGWYRDITGPGGSGSNTSNALTVTFAP